MNRRKLLALGASLALLSGCATFEPVPKDYVGPTATIRDTGFSEDSRKAQMFAVVEIDGNGIMNAFGASAMASHGRGAALTTVYPQRRVKAAPMRLLLRGSHATGAPIHAIASQIAGTFFSVEGSVEFTPQPGGVYVVKGKLKRDESSVWIEDVSTGMPASTVVTK